MAFIVDYDANVLYPNTLRDLLIRIANQPHLVQAKWTDRILDEMLDALQKNFPDPSAAHSDGVTIKESWGYAATLVSHQAP